MNNNEVSFFRDSAANKFYVFRKADFESAVCVALDLIDKRADSGESYFEIAEQLAVKHFGSDEDQLHLEFKV